MIEIQIAGAGAGKTFGLAQKIAEHYDPKCHKNIFAITYTNDASKNISDAIIKQLGFLPDNIKVQTVHTFLLNEIIYPYSPFVLNETYTTSSRCQLSFADTKGKHKTRVTKSFILKKLKNKGIMHVEEVYSAAWRIVDESHSIHCSKSKKAKVHRVLEILGFCIDKIFLDEAQDLDQTALKLFKEIGEKSVDIYMVGDPKQAIKYPESFKEFLKNNESNKLITYHPNISTSRRVPQNILNISNRFCPENQKQRSLSKTTGKLKYIVSTTPNYEDFLKKHIQSGSLVSIYQKTGNYSTKSINSKPEFDLDIEELLIEHNKNIDHELLIGTAKTWLAKIVPTQSPSASVTQFLEEFHIPYSSRTYAQLCHTINSYDSSKSNIAKYAISSITRTKGLESDTCILVLTPSIHKYLMQSGIKNSEKYNKMWNLVYVALTRTKSNFIVAVDKDLFNLNSG
ncbi:DEAD/DEAH box helicase, partial [Xenorhabdus sp. 18]|uniref:UvrD-helicase domain-containing protein n=1 Tax=Xenorhabdus doucetiae TaxID=351671 RepID=UPI0019994E56